MKKKRGPKGIMINLLAQGYKIIDSNILQSMLKSKLQIRENVNKLIVMRENIVLSQKKGMMDINLRYVAAVTSLRGDLTFLNHLLSIHTKVISSNLRKNEHVGG